MTGSFLHDTPADAGLSRAAVIFYTVLLTVDLAVLVWSWRVWVAIHAPCFVGSLAMFGWASHRAGDDIAIAEREAVG